MTVTIEIEKNFTVNQENKSSEFDLQDVADRVLMTVLDELQCPYEAQAALLLTDDDSICEINRQMREIDRSTDVLSFPVNEFESPADFSKIEEDLSVFDPDSGELLLGDIVISVDHAEKQASEYGHSLLREYAFLMVHSLLHLCGYDHIVEEDAVLMEEKQRIIMNKLGITRED